MLIWLALAVGGISLASAVEPGLRAGEPAAFWIVNIPAFTGCWWFTMWCPLGGRIRWRRLIPCAVATGAFWTGMYAVFSAIFSAMIISYNREYGPIGIVFALMTFSSRSGW